MATALHVGDMADLLHGDKVHFNLFPASLAQHSIAHNEAQFSARGALVAYTNYTGRVPKDKFLIKDGITSAKVAWGAVNQPFDSDKFDALYDRVMEHLAGRELYVQDLFCGADAKYRLPVRFINEYAWHNLFVRQLFVRPSADELRNHKAEFTVISAPEFRADPKRDGTHSEAFILVNFTRGVVLIGGTSYAGEMKKCIFGIMNFLLPQRNVFPMHCSANIGDDGCTALFFGLSGTGKTTLSADPTRRLIGDDEHGWSENGIFNFEGGCYAKCIKLSRRNEPQIFNAIRFGCVLENVVIDPYTHQPDYNNDSITENTRAAYPIEFIDNSVIPGIGGHPRHLLFLTADAFGVLPPISRLTAQQAMYHFLSGYTAKVAGTEAGIKEPTATFSTCFGAPFMPMSPSVYAEMLGQRLARHNAQCWLVNTGWQGGQYGVGKRMDLPYTRAMVDSIVEGKLSEAEFEVEPTFGFNIPKSCPGVPPAVLNPRNAWADKSAYDRQAAALCERFRKNFEAFDAPAEVKNAGPAAARSRM